MVAATAKSILLTCDMQMFYWLNCKYFKLFLSSHKAQFTQLPALNVFLNACKYYKLWKALFIAYLKKAGGEVKITSKKKKKLLYWEKIFLCITWEVKEFAMQRSDLEF